MALVAAPARAAMGPIHRFAWTVHASVLTSYAQYFFEGRHAVERLAHPVLVHGHHPLLDSVSTQLGRSGMAHDVAAQRVAHGQHFHDADATRIAGVRALLAASRVMQRNIVAVGELPRSQLVHR